MNEIAPIAERAAGKNLQLLVAGGLAVEVHGYQRKTFDANLVVRRADREAWLELMREMRFSLFHEEPAFLQLNPPEESELPPVDLMLMNDETFGNLAATAILNPSGSSLPRIVSPQSSVAMKCHAIRHGHAGQVVRDADDLIHLFMASRLDPETAEWRELVLKYGKNSGASAKQAKALDLDLPNFSGMDRFTPKLSPKGTLLRNEKWRKSADVRSEPSLPKCEVEFVF